MAENNQDESEEEEEILCYMDFNSKVEDDLFLPEKAFKIIGIDTDEPHLQLGNQVFKGEWKDTMGTHVFFEEDDNPQILDPLFSGLPSTMLRFTYKTNKILHMSRIFVNPKESEENYVLPKDEEIQGVTEDLSEMSMNVDPLQ